MGDTDVDEDKCYSLFFFHFCVSVHHSISQIKHQLDATLCRFYFCRVTLHVSGVKRPSSGVLQIGTMATGTDVIFAGRPSHHHIMDFPNMVMWWPTCNYNTRTRDRRASFLILLMMDAWRPKHVDWLCWNKTCTVLHQVGVLFAFYCLWSHLSGSLMTNRIFCLRWKFQNWSDTSNSDKMWMDTQLAPCLPFQT